MAKGGNYAVGYGRPPKHTRFKKGESGNPSGRKKAAPSLQDELADVLATVVTVNENGRPVKMTIQRLMLKAAATKAAKGDGAAFKRLTEMVAKAPASGRQGDDDHLASEDETLIERALARRMTARGDRG